MRSALSEASGFPFTSTVRLSSFSEVIKLPNHDFFVSSGEDSGVNPTSSEEAERINQSIVTNVWV